MSFRVGDMVRFGRPNGAKTLGEVIKVNRKSLKIKTVEERGAGRGSGAGTIWTVHPSLVSAVLQHRPFEYTGQSISGASDETLLRQMDEPERSVGSRRGSVQSLIQLIPQQPLRQDSMIDQLNDLRLVANRLGLTGLLKTLRLG